MTEDRRGAIIIGEGTPTDVSVDALTSAFFAYWFILGPGERIHIQFDILEDEKLPTKRNNLVDVVTIPKDADDMSKNEALIEAHQAIVEALATLRSHQVLKVKLYAIDGGE